MVTMPPRKSLFLDSVATGQHRHTSEWIATDIERVITQNNIKFAGVVTDNTSANKKAWEILSARFPSLFFQGCTSHGLDLLFKDIFAAERSTKPGDNQPSFPVGYPFENLQHFLSDVKDIVKFFIAKRPRDSPVSSGSDIPLGSCRWHGLITLSSVNGRGFPIGFFTLS
jgi:Protein of unknown function (DUF 659)